MRVAKVLANSSWEALLSLPSMLPSASDGNAFTLFKFLVMIGATLGKDMFISAFDFVKPILGKTLDPPLKSTFDRVSHFIDIVKDHIEVD